MEATLVNGSSLDILQCGDAGVGHIVTLHHFQMFQMLQLVFGQQNQSLILQVLGLVEDDLREIAQILCRSRRLERAVVERLALTEVGKADMGDCRLGGIDLQDRVATQTRLLQQSGVIAEVLATSVQVGPPHFGSIPNEPLSSRPFGAQLLDLFLIDTRRQDGFS